MSKVFYMIWQSSTKKKFENTELFLYDWKRVDFSINSTFPWTKDIWKYVHSIEWKKLHRIIEDLYYADVL